MQKNKGAGCLAITRSTIDILMSLAAQTSRGALMALAVVGVGIPTAVHAFHVGHARPVAQVSQVGKDPVTLSLSAHPPRDTVG